MHAIIKEVRGAVNIIPDLAVCQVETRAPDKAMLAGLTEAVINCAKSCAAAVNTEVSWKKFMKSFDSMLPKTQVVPSIAAAWEFIFGMSFISSGSKHHRFAKISLSGKFI